MSTAIREQLRTLSFVEGLTDTALHQLSHLLQPAEYACDQLLYSQGDERKIMAIVVSGAVAIEKPLNGRPIRVATLGPGEAVGEGLLLNDATHGTLAVVRVGGGPSETVVKRCAELLGGFQIRHVVE